ncbi:hypothetical protein [Aquirhabdus sp.]|uniref:hypothetical protein n=1 Tax=Aquirhabdus sp. TaxID=2824160 RepID=UPI00396CAF7A
MTTHKFLERKYLKTVFGLMIGILGLTTLAGCESKADKITKQHQQEAIDLANQPGDFKDLPKSTQSSS